MADRARRSTERGTGSPSAKQQQALFGASAATTSPAAAAASTAGPGGVIGAAAIAGEPATAAVEQATPTVIDRHRPEPASAPIRVISLKAATDTPAKPVPRVPPLHVQLRQLAEVAGSHDVAGLGRLAPPRDPEAARARRVRRNLIPACVAIGLACAVALATWLIIGR